MDSGVAGMQPVLADSDEAWAQRALADHEAFAELVRRYADRIYNLAYRMTGDRAEAEDLAQETFVRAYRGLPGYKPQHPFGAWIYRIAVNVCLTYRQRHGSAASESLSEETEAILYDNISDDSIALADLAERREVQATVQQAILSLPPMYRAVVVLYHLEGRSYEEIADLLHVPLNTVRTHLHRGRALLREKLAGNARL
jgi:RNA polymerase sigma-70 factor (ECF subfamily)